MLPLILCLLLEAPASAAQSALERLKGSLFTVEVHSGNERAKSVQGSGYLVSEDGRIATNYHVVGSYVEEPERYRIRVRGALGEREAELLTFDLVNDLAVLQVRGLEATPLPLAAREPAPGTSVIAFGNPEGLGLSQIDGIFNGHAEKGLVERMLLSMPLNSGMSGGPILDGHGEVIGTNVAVMRGSNSLSFGVPVSKLAALLAEPPLAGGKLALLAETRRQLEALERGTSRTLLEAFRASRGNSPIRVGAVRALRPPGVFECWDVTEEMKPQGLTKTRYACDLQFTPFLEAVGPVASVELLVEHFVSTRSAYGFYKSLADHAATHHEVEARNPEDGHRTAPRCLGDRVRTSTLTFGVETCLSAYVREPGLFDFDLVATSLDRPREAAYVALHFRAFTTKAALGLAREVLESVALTASSAPESGR